MMRQKVRQERSETRRRQILDAALACFTEYGFNETTMAHIRRRSNASTGSIYHHFGSKEQLASALYLEGIRDYQAGLLRVLQDREDAREGILAVVHYHLGWVGSNPDWARFLFQMRHAEFMAGTESDFDRLNEGFAREVAAWVRPRMERRELRRLPPDVFISVLLGPCQEFVRLWLSGKAVSGVEAAVEKIGEAVWRALRFHEVPPL